MADGEIKTFKEVFDWIIYDYEDQYPLSKDNDGNFYVNKLYINETELSYKTELLTLAPGLFSKVEKLYKLFEPDPNSVKFTLDE